MIRYSKYAEKRARKLAEEWADAPKVAGQTKSPTGGQE